MDSDFIINKEIFLKTNRLSLESHYDVHPKRIGQGSTGSVFKVREKEQKDASWRAAKILSKDKINEQSYLLNQIKVLKSLDHPNIIKIYEIFEDSIEIAIVQEYYSIYKSLCLGGELFDKIVSSDKFSQRDVRVIFRQIVEAIFYCHIHHVSHRDLKPQNILFLRKDSLDLKLIDFGVSFSWDHSMHEQLSKKSAKNFVGTAYYIAPQILHNPNQYDQRCDIWSLGIILYVLLTAVPPFDGSDNKQIFANIMKYKYSFNIPEMKGVSNQAKDLIKKILVPANQRITIQQILKHPWMTNQPSPIPLKLNIKNFNNFCRYSKTKKLAANFIASQLQAPQIDTLTKLFKQLDLNKDGEISLDEMKQALSKEGIGYAELRRLMDSIDTDHNGKINYTQFLASASGDQLFDENSVKRAFSMLDRDGNGVVERKQLIQLFSECGMRQVNGKNVDDILEQCDQDGNGVIDFEQFRACLMKK